jgi:hypothetical protein
VHGKGREMGGLASFTRRQIRYSCFDYNHMNLIKPMFEELKQLPVYVSKIKHGGKIKFKCTYNFKSCVDILILQVSTFKK